jgi:hypothetical protein
VLPALDVSEQQQVVWAIIGFGRLGSSAMGKKIHPHLNPFAAAWL